MERVSFNRIMYFDGFDNDCSDQLSALIVQKCLKMQGSEKINLKNETKCLNKKYLLVCAQLFHAWITTDGQLHNELLVVLKKIPQFEFFIEYFKPYLK